RSGGDGGHAGRKNQGSIYPFELRNRLLSYGVRRIAITRIEPVGVGRPKLLVVVGDLESRGLIDRCGEWAVLLAQIDTCTNGLRLRMLFAWSHVPLLLTRRQFQKQLRAKAIRPIARGSRWSARQMPSVVRA